MESRAEELLDEEPPSIEPYTILGIEKSATAGEIKRAYRTAALQHHPDKAAESEKAAAHTKFQEVAFAYAVLSDAKRRKRYDATGSTSESLDADDSFSWFDFYAEQFQDVITGAAIEDFSKGYKGSDEEKDDLLAAYEKNKGEWSPIYAEVMLSDPLEDEDRFRNIIDQAIEKGDVPTFKAYTEETAKQKEKRMRAVRREEKEAMEYAKKLGVDEKLFGSGKDGKKTSGEDALAALITKKQAGRSSFLHNLEAKYAAPSKLKATGKGRKAKRGPPEEEEEDDGMPAEEAFQQTAEKLWGKEADEGGRKSKRTKR